MIEILFTDVNVLDCTGREPFLGEVLVQDNRIEAVGAGIHSLARNEAKVIHGGGGPF